MPGLFERMAELELDFPNLHFHHDDGCAALAGDIATRIAVTRSALAALNMSDQRVLWVGA